MGHIGRRRGEPVVVLQRPNRGDGTIYALGNLYGLSYVVKGIILIIKI